MRDCCRCDARHASRAACPFLEVSTTTLCHPPPLEPCRSWQAGHAQQIPNRQQQQDELPCVFRRRLHLPKACAVEEHDESDAENRSSNVHIPNEPQRRRLRRCCSSRIGKLIVLLPWRHLRWECGRGRPTVVLRRRRACREAPPAGGGRCYPAAAVLAARVSRLRRDHHHPTRRSPNCKRRASAAMRL